MSRAGRALNGGLHRRRPVISGALGGALLTVGLSIVPVSAATPVACAGTVSLTPTSVSVRAAGPTIVESINYTGEHGICLADGRTVTATLVGSLSETIGSNGIVILFHFDELAAYDGGTLGYRGDASLTTAGWQSAVRTVGWGTGPLAGIEGRGTFAPTGPTTFTDVISYTYH